MEATMWMELYLWGSEWFRSFTWARFWGTLTLCLALGFTLFGLPSQILKNATEKSCGISLHTLFFAFGIYLSRASYAFTIKSWFIFIPDAIGSVLGAVLLVQYFQYRKRK